MVYMDVTAIFIWHFFYKKKCFSSQCHLLVVATFNFTFVVFFLKKNTEFSVRLSAYNFDNEGLKSMLTPALMPMLGK